jgi:tritrans,polycis-undecaprenyl-diphosphate synthase [geranylgeranyl-diphosphate specific]
MSGESTKLKKQLLPSADERLVPLLREATETAAKDSVSPKAIEVALPQIEVRGKANSLEYCGELGHLGVIIDGNRRYGKKSSMKLDEAYRRGAEKVYEVVRHVFERTGIREISIYALSHENLLRRSEEVDAMLRIQKQAFDEWISDPFFWEKGIRIKFVGDRSMLPPDFRESCDALEKKTSGNIDRTLNILVAYGGRREISSAVESIIREAVENRSDGRRMDVETLISENLCVNSPVDLIIRTGGGHRLSGFLLWQSDYAEIVAMDKLWPEVEMEDIDRAIVEFCSAKTKRGL